MANKRIVRARARPLVLPKGKLLRVGELAKIANMSPKTVYNMVAAAQEDPDAPDAIPFIRIGAKSLRFDPEKIERWIARRTQGGVA